MCSSSPLPISTPPKKTPLTTSTTCLPSIRPPPLILSLLLLRFLPSVFYRLSPVIFSCWDISQLTVVTATAGRLRTPSKRAHRACGLIKRLFGQVYVTSFRNVSSNLWVAKLQPPELRSVSTPALRSVKVGVEATLPQSNRDVARVGFYRRRLHTAVHAHMLRLWLKTTIRNDERTLELCSLNTFLDLFKGQRLSLNVRLPELYNI